MFFSYFIIQLFSITLLNELFAESEIFFTV